MKFQKGIQVILSVLVLLLLGGCGNSSADAQTGEAARTEQENGEDLQDAETESDSEDETDGEDAADAEETPMRAVFLKNETGELFVKLDQETPFFGQIPNEILDEAGEPLAHENMQSGDVYLVYGDGIMLQSYPGQYPGITKLVRQECANQEYIERYEAELNQFLPEADPSQVPDLSVNYRQPDAVVTSVVERGGYEWQVAQEGDTAQDVTVDADHVLRWGDQLTDLVLSEETPITLLFSYEPEEIHIQRWPLSLLGDESTKDAIPEGEEVETEAGEEGPTFFGKTGYVYQITGIWPEGRVEYGLQIRARE